MGCNDRGQLGLKYCLYKHEPAEVLEDQYVRFVECGAQATIACVEKRDFEDSLVEVALFGTGDPKTDRLLRKLENFKKSRNEIARQRSPEKGRQKKIAHKGSLEKGRK